MFFGVVAEKMHVFRRANYAQRQSELGYFCRPSAALISGITDERSPLIHNIEYNIYYDITKHILCNNYDIFYNIYYDICYGRSRCSASLAGDSLSLTVNP